MVELIIKKFSEHAVIPRKANETDAGFDLSSIDDYVIEPFTSKLIDIGIGITVPDNTYGRIAPRSGLSVKNLFVNAGVIDQGYTNTIKVILYNGNTTSYNVNKGDRVAQLIIEKIEMNVTIIERDELGISTRGQAGFGSTGL